MGGVATRDEILKGCDVTVLLKPVVADLRQMKREGTLWGWAHAVQQFDITQAAVDRRLTLITWEGMNKWAEGGAWQSHTFFRNNEIAGYAGVLHAVGLRGIVGEYGGRLKVAVINYGSVGQGAVKALQSLGFTDITLYVVADSTRLMHAPPGVAIVRIEARDDGQISVHGDSFIAELEKMDIIVNGILQDPLKPLMFFAGDEASRLKRGALIIDISCDEGMGFPFARPTSFADPMLSIGHIHYYAVDHTPSYLWNSASWEISQALLPYLPTVMSGPSAWQQSETIRRAIEIRDGVILNPHILSFQERDETYPHKRI
jgi:alanine dehydrogenase